MKRNLTLFGAFLFISSLALVSCKKDKVEGNDEEVITTLQLTFTPNGGGSTLTYKYDDPDGPGGANPTIDEIVLAPSTTYSVSLSLLNKTTNPVDNITTEIEAEADAHRFYYAVTPGTNIMVTGLDDDPNGVPLGLNCSWTTGPVATGKVKITLRHYPGNPPNKEFADLVNSTKSGTDMEVEFNTRIQ